MEPISIFSAWNTPCDQITMKSMEGLLSYTSILRSFTTMKPVRPNELALGCIDKHIVVSGLTENFILTRTAFEYLCRHLDAPANFLRRLPEHIVVLVLNSLLHSQAASQTNMIVTRDESNSTQRFIIRGFRDKLAYWDYELIRAVTQVYNESTGWGSYRKPVWSEDGFSFSLVQDKVYFEIAGVKFRRGLRVIGCETDYTKTSVRTFLYSNDSVMFTGDKGFEQVMKKSLLKQLNGQLALVFSVLQEYSTRTGDDKMFMDVAANTPVSADVKQLATWLFKQCGIPVVQAAVIAQKFSRAVALTPRPNGLDLLLFVGSDTDLYEHTAKLLEGMARPIRAG